MFEDQQTNIKFKKKNQKIKKKKRYRKNFPKCPKILQMSFKNKIKNQRFWTKLEVSRRFQLAIYTVFDVEFESAVRNNQILQEN